MSQNPYFQPNNSYQWQQQQWQQGQDWQGDQQQQQHWQQQQGEDWQQQQWQGQQWNEQDWDGPQQQPQQQYEEPRQNQRFQMGNQQQQSNPRFGGGNPRFGGGGYEQVQQQQVVKEEKIDPNNMNFEEYQALKKAQKAAKPKLMVKKSPSPDSDSAKEIAEKVEKENAEKAKEREKEKAKIEKKEREEKKKKEAEKAADAAAKAAAEEAAMAKAAADTAANAEDEFDEDDVEEEVCSPAPSESPPESEASMAKGGVERKRPDPRPHVNVVFIGHVDAGKSTTCGNILYLSGQVDERTIEKFMKEAKEKNRESWWLAYIMDTNEEEKAKGKTVELGRAHFETENRRFTILDAPGHKSYVPNAISGLSMADIGVLIISARKGEFETGFEKGGQTREHALLAKTLGVERLVVAINKMDDHSVKWEKERYDEIVGKMGPFLKQNGFKDEDVTYVPMSGLIGDNIKDRKNSPSWVSGDTLLGYFDKVSISSRNPDGALRLPMLDGFRDMGAPVCMGKIEQGYIKPNDKVVIMPIKKESTVISVFIDDQDMSQANTGENVTLKLQGVNDDDLRKGYVVCPLKDPCRACPKFKCAIKIVELLSERPVITAGYKLVIHLHTAIEEAEISKLEMVTDLKTKKVDKKPKFARVNTLLNCVISIHRPTCMDVFTGCPQLGRFTLRDEGVTIAIGKIIELPKEK